MNHLEYMSLALKEAHKAFKIGETPIGAVLVYEGKVIAKAHNKREKKQDVSCHAEILAIKRACKKLKSWRLEGCSIYVTLEPCIMCAGAMIQSRIQNCYYGATNKRFGSHTGDINLFSGNYNHKVNVVGGILEEECSNLISNFFKEVRNERGCK